VPAAEEVVLVVDDDRAFRAMMRRVLERAGFTVTTSLSATEGLAAFDTSPTDLVITDIIMPRMHGVAVIKAIRARRPQTRIVAISGGGNFGPLEYQPEAITTSAYLAVATQAGADAVLTKPFDKADLIATVQRLLADAV